MTADKGLSVAALVDGEERFEFFPTAQALHLAGTGAAPVLLENRVRDEARAEEEGEGKEGCDLAIACKLGPTDAEGEKREGEDRSDDRWDRAVAVEPCPRLSFGVDPEADLLIEVLVRELEIEVADKEGDGAGREQERGEHVEQENPAPGH